MSVKPARTRIAPSPTGHMHLATARNALYWNRGDGTYADIALYAGVEATGWSWSLLFLDVDLDGYEDLLCTTSHMFEIQDLDAENHIRSKGPWPPERVPQKLLLFPKMTQPKQAFRNRGDLTFEDETEDKSARPAGESKPRRKKE